MAERITTSLQESVLTLLVYHDAAGQQIANIVEASLFEGDYRVIAERVIEFWRRHKAAPKEHVSDLIGEILEDKDIMKRNTVELYGQILHSMYETHATINAPFVLTQVTNFIRVQKIKLALQESVQKLASKDELVIRDVEEIWSNLLKVNEIGFDAGMRLNEIDRMLAHLDKQATEFVFGIGALDKNYIVPRRATLTNLHGAPGDGKTWFLINVGKHNLMRGKKVLHITLEFDAEDVMQRYFQALFSITDREAERLILTSIKRHSNGRLNYFGEYTVRPDFSFASNTIRMELETRITDIIGMSVSENLIVKRWPPNRITPRDVEAFIDGLEMNERWSPDIILFDYPRLYKIDMRNPWLSIGERFTDTRATLVERNIAGVSVHQFSRQGAQAQTRDMTQSGESWTVNQTCDTVLSLSKTAAEKEFGLARILIDKARKARDKFQIIMTQSYDIGQFCLDSMMFDMNYDKVLRSMTNDEDEEEEDKDE